MNLRSRFPVMALLTVLAAEAFAQPAVDTSRRNAVVRAIEEVSPAVVSIGVVVVRRETVAHPFMRDFWSFFDMPRFRQRLRGEEVQAAGSGFVFDDNGHVLTNYHVVEGAAKVWAVASDGRRFDLELVGADPRTDLAVFRTEETGLAHVSFGDSDQVYTGEWAIAIGNPFGTLMGDNQPTVSVGVVSARNRRISRDVVGQKRLYQGMLQTDAAINPGNSGGPLVNAQGDVIGVNTMIMSRSGGSVGMGFAVPINRARRVAEEIIRYGRRRDPWPGFKVEDLGSYHESVLRQYGIGQREGSLVVEIMTTCPAYNKGLRVGDIIVAVNDEALNHSYELDFAIWDLFVGDVMALDVIRTVDGDTRRKTIRFAIEELDGPPR